MSSAAGGAAGGAGAGAAVPKEKRTDLGVQARQVAVAEVLRTSQDGVAKHGVFTAVAEQFNTNRRSIARLWKQYQLQNPTE